MGVLSQDCSACRGVGFTKPGMGVNVGMPGYGMGGGMAGPGYGQGYGQGYGAGMPGVIPPSMPPHGVYAPHYGYGPRY